jgi:tetratricopeptide (TPR) repeat protein
VVAICMDKLAALREILTLDANNSFARYGIAMELLGQALPEEALAEFNTLLERDPEYVAAYFMSAQALAAGGRTAEAVARLKGGIASANRNGNMHARSEMQAMLDDLER